MNDQSNNTNESKMSDIELAAWAVVSEPLDAQAIERVKSRAKQLGHHGADFDSASTDESDQLKPSRRKPSTQDDALNRRYSSWMFPGAIAAMVAFVVCAFAFFMGSSSTAFAAALKKLEKVRAFSYEELIYLKEGDEPHTTKVMVAEDGRTRSEFGDLISIKDENHNVRLTLENKSKTAIVIGNRINPHPINELAWFEELKRMDGEVTRDLGEKEIDGQVVIGKEIKLGQIQVNVWVDKKAEELFMVELLDRGDKTFVKSVKKNFNFNLQVEESLFSYEVPEGYKIENSMPDIDFITELASSPEDNLIVLLKAFAEKSSGKFPDTLTDFGEWAKVMVENDKPNMEMASRFGVVGPTLRTMDAGYGYLGKGKAFNQKDRAIVFWYKTKANIYRGIFTDLTVGDVEEDDLPINPPQQNSPSR